MASRSVPCPTSRDMRCARASQVAARAARLSGSTSPVSPRTIRPSRLATAVPMIPVTLSCRAASLRAERRPPPAPLPLLISYTSPDGACPSSRRAVAARRTAGSGKPPAAPPRGCRSVPWHGKSLRLNPSTAPCPGIRPGLQPDPLAELVRRRLTRQAEAAA